MTATNIVRAKNADIACTVGRTALAQAVRWSVGAISWPSHMLPVLSGALLVVENGVLTVSTFDYETSGVAQIPAPGGSGAALVPAKMLMSMLHVMPRDADVRITTISGQRGILRVRMEAGDDVTMELPTLPMEEYPALPARGEPLFTTTGAEFKRLSRAAIAAGGDQTLPILTSVHLSTHDGRIEAAATDRYRLTVTSIKGRWPSRIGPVNLSAKTFATLGRAFASESTVEVFRSREEVGYDLVTVVSGARTLHARCVEGEFPKYRALMTHDVTRTVTAPTGALTEAAQRAAVCVRSSPIVMHFGKQAGKGAVMAVSGGIRAQDTGEASSRALVREITDTGGAEDFDIAANPRYLIDALRSIDGDTAELRMGSNVKPMTIVSPTDPTFTYLLMPVRLAD